MTRKTVSRLMLTLAAAGWLAGGAGRVAADDSSVTSPDSLDHATGAEIYARICQGCHMPGALGAVGAGRYPSLAGDPALVAWQYVALTVLNGKSTMPAFGLPKNETLEIRSVHLSDAQVADVVNYVRSHFGNRYKATVNPEQVAALPHPGPRDAP